MEFVKKIFFFAIATLIYSLFFVGSYNLIRHDTLFTEESLFSEFISFVINYIPSLFIAGLNYLVIFKFDWWSKKGKFLWLKICKDLIFSFVILMIVNYLFLIIGHQFQPGIGLNWVGSMLNSFLIFLILQTIFYIKSSYRSLIEVEQERLKVFQYQYNALKAQINPHFLFNSLNILYSLVSIDTQRSKQFILELSKMYRYIMDQHNQQQIKLKDEFIFLDSYIAVLKMRYHHQFNVEVKDRELITDEKVIPYTLQLLIENVIKHNVISSKNPMKVFIQVTPTGLKIQNPIHKKIGTDGNGIGLGYLSDQYNFFEKRFEIENDGVNFTLKVPYL